jgi:hypothetical protein
VGNGLEKRHKRVFGSFLSLSFEKFSEVLKKVNKKIHFILVNFVQYCRHQSLKKWLIYVEKKIVPPKQNSLAYDKLLNLVNFHPWHEKLSKLKQILPINLRSKTKDFSIKNSFHVGRFCSVSWIAIPKKMARLHKNENCPAKAKRISLC